MIWGIDFGSKLAGTTVIASLSNQKIECYQSEKKQDADEWILAHFRNLKPHHIFIDAPLSLPFIYKTGQGQSYFYRQCDVELKCMSPMFLGGLTARAMQLSAKFKQEGVLVFETYPAALAREIGLAISRYKKEKEYLKEAELLLQKELSLPVCNLKNWHQFDAHLALTSALRHQSGLAKVYGLVEEGLIWV